MQCETECCVADISQPVIKIYMELTNKDPY